MSTLILRDLRAGDIPVISAAFAELGWNKPASQYERYLAEQEAGQRIVRVACCDDVFCGYLTVCWQAHYRPFREEGVPEIVDFNVLPAFRRRGIGSALMDAAEELIAAVGPTAGLGVGMTADYGAAQRLYAQRGYIPDGRGLMYEGHPINYGKAIPVDDDLCLYLTKTLSSSSFQTQAARLDQTVRLP